jgi:UDP-N-acetylmuramate: L-alanyl-gamma-D-glutamyl-meso-diaminopimelate ligase
VEYGPTSTRFTVTHDGEPWCDIETPLAGAFNVRNSLAAIAVGVSVGAERGRIAEALRTFRSVRRRMEVRGIVDGVTVIDDFAHHPTAVRETIAATRQRYPGHRLVAVFEPRSYTAQRREFQDDYQRAFAWADEVILGGLFHPERYTPETALNPTELVDAWTRAGTPAFQDASPDRIAEHLARTASTGDVILIMSNGGFGGIHDKLLEALKLRAPSC